MKVVTPFFKYDLFQYKKYLDILYCPNINFAKLGLDDFFIKELPPGCKINTDVTNYKKVKEKKDNYIKVFMWEE